MTRDPHHGRGARSNAGGRYERFAREAFDDGWAEEEIVRLEEQSDQLYLDGLKALLHGPAKTDAMAYIKGAEIYDHLEKVVDCFQDVANRVSGLVIEHL